MSDARPTGWGGTPAAAAGIDRIREAAARIRGFAVRTPIVPTQAAPGLFLKPETLQPTGAYKIRGAYNWASHLTEEQRRAGLSTISAGNTALAVGHVARRFGVESRSLLPETAPQSKIDAIRCYGTEAVLVPMERLIGYIFDAGWEHEPYSFLHPWVDPHMLAGSGTIGLEIFEELPDVETVFVPVGGGGLVGGVGAALKALKASIRVVGVQSVACPALRASFDAGHPSWVDPRPTICDGTAVPFVVDEMYPLLRAVVDDVVLVSEKQVRAAIRSLALGSKLIAEGSGALAVAGALATPPEQRGRSIAVVTGANIDTKRLIEVMRSE